MTPATIIVAALVAVIFIAIVVTDIRKKLQGKSSCSCGGNCGACGICSHSESESDT